MNPVKGIINSLVVDSPWPGNLKNLWGLGSTLGLALVIQIITGVFLAMYYIGEMELALISVEMISSIMGFYGLIVNCINKLEYWIIMFNNNNIMQGLMGVITIIYFLYYLKKKIEWIDQDGDGEGRGGGGGGGENNKRKWDIRNKLQGTWLGEIIINPEGDLLSGKYAWLNRGGKLFGIIVIFNWLTKWTCKNIVQADLVEGKENLPLEVIMLLSNLVMWMIILMMIFKAVIMTTEVSRRVYRGVYTVEIPGGMGGPGGPRKPQKRVLWSRVTQEATRVSWQIARATVGVGAGVATTGMALDWYGQATGQGQIGTNCFRTVVGGMGFNVPKPE